MARDRANIRLDMWGDADWRKLSIRAQYLYMLLLSHPKTNRAGISEWHPGRLSMLSAGTTPADIVEIADELVAGHFIVIDETSEEVLIRSYIKHDGVLTQPNMTTTMANDWAGTASLLLRQVIAFEVQKAQSRDPENKAWANSRVRTILESEAVDAKTLTHEVTLRFTHEVGHELTHQSGITDGIGSPIGLGSPTSTSTTTPSSTKKGGVPASPGTRIPDDFGVTPEMKKWASEKAPDVEINTATEKFIDHWRAKAGVAALKTDWPATWRNWLRSDQERAPQRGHPAPQTNAQRNLSVVQQFAALESAS
jgi:hypothetical protein